MAVNKSPNHYRSPWVGRGLVIALLVLLVALIIFRKLQPDYPADLAREGAAFTARADAAEARSDAVRAEAEKARQGLL